MSVAHSSILNRPEEVVAHSRESGREGVTSNAVLREGTPRISLLYLNIISPRKYDISTNEVNKD